MLHCSVAKYEALGGVYSEPSQIQMATLVQDKDILVREVRPQPHLQSHRINNITV
jgi:hypothetical protein